MKSAIELQEQHERFLAEQKAIFEAHKQTLDSILKVVVEEITGGYRYYAITTDGERILLRKKATRSYHNAYMYRRKVGPGKGFAEYFTYGKNPSSHCKGLLYKTFNIYRDER